MCRQCRRQLFAGYEVGSRPMKRKEKMHRMMISFIFSFSSKTSNSLKDSNSLHSEEL